ncbi:MAG: DEAD/DEAH box helicase, partial [Chitinophagaceae bacterium]
KGFEWMILLSQIQAGALLADDMGLGKTLQTICVIAYLYEKNPSGKFLIVTPASLSYNWQAEFQKFCPTIQTFIFHGINRSKEALTDAKNSVIITTYGTLRSEIELLQTIPFTAVVADESHYIKNPGSLASRAIVQLSATTRIALTGTPIMNNTFDLYAQLLFLLPGMFGSRDFFKKEYADPIDRERDEVKMNALKKVTAPFIFRRTKEQVATDLPQKTETVLWCTMSENQKAAYESVKERIKTSLFDSIKEKGMEASKMSILNGMLQLRQICNDTSLIKNNDFFCDESVKVKVLLTELQNIISNHKALVFSQFTQMLDILETHFQKEKITYLRLDGSTPIAERQQLVEQFQQEDGNERVFLISLKAGNAGLTLTAADYVFLFDPWWNTAVQQQAIDRTHRIGQTKNVFAYQLICKNTIEERIIQLQTAKKQIADELIAEEQSILKNLTQDDLAFLLS